MVEAAEGLDGRIWQPIRRRWRLVVGGMLVAVAVTLLVQAFVEPTYTASVVLAPSAQSKSSGNALGKLGGLASIAGVSIDKGETSEFEKLQFLVFSDRLGDYQARRPDFLHFVFATRWDPRLRQWRRSTGIGQSVKDVLNPLFGLPAWLPPDGRALAKLYDTKLSSKKLGETELVQLSYRDPDAARGAFVLAAIVNDANELLRADAALRASRQASYLRQQLGLAAVLEYRENLASLLGQQEQTLMLTSSHLPYAADMLQPVTVSAVPTSQRPYLYAGIAAVIGLSVSAFIAFLLGVPRSGYAAGEMAAVADAA